SVSIACGAHAGDEATMTRSVAEAARLGVVVGAHPGYPDRAGFGRATVDMPEEDLRRSLTGQIRLLAGIAAGHGVRLAHVKPHGALYNTGAGDAALASIIVQAVRDADPALRLIGPPGSALLDAASRAGLPGTAETFADRRYLPSGRLAPRSGSDALILDPVEAAAQAVALATARPIPTVGGGTILLAAETVSVHADTPGALEIARAIRDALDKAGVRVRAIGD
ncbi:MAG: 5-oxoprolinase subunit PxpA, partial [Actinomycetota bacterium]